MKQKSRNIFVYLIVVFTIMCSLCIIISVSSCYSDDSNDYRYEIYRRYDIEIPSEWEIVYSTGGFGGFDGVGSVYSVYNVGDNGEHFFKPFSSVKDDNFEEETSQTLEIRFNDYDDAHHIATEQLFDFEESYKWLCKKDATSRISMIYQADKLYLIYSKY